MASIEKIEAQMREAPTNVRFADLCKVCDYHFGGARQHGTSHAVYQTPWQGAPRVNIQNQSGNAKPYQVRQVLAAIAKLTETREENS